MTTISQPHIAVRPAAMPANRAPFLKQVALVTGRNILTIVRTPLALTLLNLRP